MPSSAQFSFDLKDTGTQAAIAVVLVTSVLIALFLGLKGRSKRTALNPEAYQSFKLQEKVVLSRDTRLFRFALQSKSHVLGLPIGQHISMKFVDSDGKMVTRSYTPTSSDDDIGYVDFVIKVYFPNVHPKFPDGGKLSYHLEGLKIGDTIDMMGPKGSLTYKGNGLFSIKRRPDVRVKRIGMIAGGTGITPMLQIINKILKEGSGIEVSLLFANQTEDDILLRDKIEQEYSGKGNIKYHYTLDRPPASGGWKYSEGFVNDGMLSQHMPPPADDTLILMCGPPPMIKFACIPNLDKLGYKESMYFSF